MNGKKWGLLTLALTLALLAALGGLNALVDPLFHYHAPVEGLSYELLNTRQRYLNDGISKHFDYNAIITGTSMQENSSTELCDELFGVKSVKVPYEGASFREVDENLRRVLENRDDVRLVFRTLDYFIAVNDKDDMLYDPDTFPYYLYDSDPFNDTKYLFNKAILFDDTLHTLRRTAQGLPSDGIDDYSRMSPLLFGAELPEGVVREAAESRHYASKELLAMVAGNVEQNICRTAEENPDVEFYLFFPPYSVVHWDIQRAAGLVDEQIDVAQKTAELLVGLKNVHLFCFDHIPEIICDLERYMPDGCHYDDCISDMLYEYMAAGEHRLTEENYVEYFDSLRLFIRETDFSPWLNTK